MAKIKADPNAWIRVIDHLLDEGDYNYAKETLMGIKKDIREKARVTSNQINAIQNIRRSVDRPGEYSNNN